MLAAVAAVRLRAAGLCGLLGVRDVDAAVERICNKKRTFQLVLEAHPRGMKKEGPSSEAHVHDDVHGICSVERTGSLG